MSSYVTRQVRCKEKHRPHQVLLRSHPRQRRKVLVTADELRIIVAEHPPGVRALTHTSGGQCGRQPPRQLGDSGLADRIASWIVDRQAFVQRGLRCNAGGGLSTCDRCQLPPLGGASAASGPIQRTAPELTDSSDTVLYQIGNALPGEVDQRVRFKLSHRLGQGFSHPTCAHVATRGSG